MLATITSVEVIEDPEHDRVRIWNRGSLAGELTVVKGDGKRIAARLLQDKPHLRIEPARETHLGASVHILRSPGDRGDREDREGVWVEVIGVGDEEGEPVVDLKVSSIVWDEGGSGKMGPSYRVRAYPKRDWDPFGKKRRIKLISG